jgi:hypothetical protein
LAKGALKTGDLTKAQSYASELLLIDAGQTAPVLDYFAECRVFWKMGGAKLDDWSAMVRGGGKPNFGANLLY